MQQSQQKNIIIAGAGIAGLACADALINLGYSVKILEASNRYGGRIKPLLNFLPTLLEAGGQEIHYKSSPYFQLAEQAGAKLHCDQDKEWYIWDPYQNRMILYEQFEKKYPKIANIFDYLTQKKEANLQDLNCLQQLQQDGFDMNFRHFYDYFFGAEYGCEIEKISTLGLGLSESNYEKIDENFNISNIYHQDILDKQFSKTYQFIEYNSPVKQVEINGATVMVTYGEQDQKICCDFFVSAVPITQVKKIKWLPGFDEIQQKQIDLVTMGKGGKLFIQINKKLNLKNASCIIIKTKPNFQLWNNSIGKFHILVGLVTETGVKVIQSTGLQKYVEDIIYDLQEQFGSNFKILKYHFEDWGSQPYIEGLYSYPLPGIMSNYREIIGRPINNKVFFCGEAYHLYQPSTIHGAYESAISTAKLIQNYYQN